MEGGFRKAALDAYAREGIPIVEFLKPDEEGLPKS